MELWLGLGGAALKADRDTASRTTSARTALFAARWGEGEEGSEGGGTAGVLEGPEPGGASAAYSVQSRAVGSRC